MFPNFFPGRQQSFSLKLPNGKQMQSKVCQDGEKALMSYSNKELGEWILRHSCKVNKGSFKTSTSNSSRTKSKLVLSNLFNKVLFESEKE
jgi:hypothetical protein